MPIPVRCDFDAALVRRAARASCDGSQARRLLALAAIYDGASRTEAATIGGVTLQVVRDWVLRFNARGPDGLINGKAPGKPSRLNDTHRTALVQAIEAGPVPAIDGVVRWRLIDSLPPSGTGAWPITSRASHANAVTTCSGEDLAARSNERRSVFPSIAITPRPSSP